MSLTEVRICSVYVYLGCNEGLIHEWEPSLMQIFTWTLALLWPFLQMSTTIHIFYRVGPDSPFALLSPVLVSEIPFEKGFLENLAFVALFCARNSPFSKNILALSPCSGDPKCPAPPCFYRNKMGHSMWSGHTLLRTSSPRFLSKGLCLLIDTHIQHVKPGHFVYLWKYLFDP